VLPVTVTSFAGDGLKKVLSLPKEHGADWRSAVEPQAIPGPDDYPAGREVRIPQKIVVHMGYCKDHAENVQVPFLEYLKNIASNEAYPDWDKGALYASIYCFATFALNRVYTEWYRNQGFPFDITSDPRSDPLYLEGRPVPQIISQIVELSFNVFLSRKGTGVPIFPLYCGGQIPCSGFSMKDALQMSVRGYSPLDILKHFFGKGLKLEESLTYYDSDWDRPARLLAEGESGDDVQHIQNCLNAVRRNYPNIPLIEKPQGMFDEATKLAVTEFQWIFQLTVNGVLSSATWSQITLICWPIERIDALLSLGERFNFSSPPEAKLYYGVDSEAETESLFFLHHMLNFISLFNPAIPSVKEEGFFGYETEESVAAFQRAFKISEAGAVGPVTWHKLLAEYKALLALITRDPYEESDLHPGFEDVKDENPIEPGDEPEAIIKEAAPAEAVEAFELIEKKEIKPEKAPVAANGSKPESPSAAAPPAPAAKVAKELVQPAAQPAQSPAVPPARMQSKQFFNSLLYPGNMGLFKELSSGSQHQGASKEQSPAQPAAAPKLAFMPKSNAIMILLLFLLFNSFKSEDKAHDIARKL
jgi:peptidoglycan hydrolase-like protein with peptidoglycan-binding domain